MKTRYRMHQQPGDHSRRTKASMLEGKHPNKKVSKSFKKCHLLRERAILKRRASQEIEEGTDGKVRFMEQV